MFCGESSCDTTNAREQNSRFERCVGLTEAAMQSDTKRQDRSVVQCDPSVLSWRWWMKAGDAHSEGRPVTYAYKQRKTSVSACHIMRKGGA